MTLIASVQYRVESPESAFYKLTDSHSQISSYVFDVVRARCAAAGRSVRGGEGSAGLLRSAPSLWLS